MKTTHLALSFMLASFVVGCGSVQKAEPVPEPKVVAPAPEPEPLPRISGDDQVPARFQTRFGEWLRAENSGGGYTRVVEVSEVNNAVSVVVERRLDAEGACLVGPSTVAIIEEGGAMNASVEHHGEDCCPGTTCTMTPPRWNMRYLNAVAAKDLSAQAALVSTKKKLTYELVTPKGKSKRVFATKDFAGKKPPELPGCGFVNTKPSCEPGDDKGFTCSCHGGGTHTTFEWSKEGDGFKLVKINESSS